MPAPPADDAGEPELIERLRAEIDSTGPITFARFMERALTEPGLGYYATSIERPSRTGDFLTAPEMHPIFGQVLGAGIGALWTAAGNPDPYTLVEYGAGAGTLFASIADHFERSGSRLATALRYRAIDLPQQREAEAEPVVGCVLANEFIDALPVHVVVNEGGRLQEVFVDWVGDRFGEVLGEPSDDRLDGWFANRKIELRDGQRAEVNLAMLEWLAELGAVLECGHVMIIDYGLPAEELYSTDRQAGTLRAFREQHVSSDVLSGVGHQDITAHVDLDALEAGARAAGFEVVTRTRLAEYLLTGGLEDAYAGARAEADLDWNAALELRSAVRRLLDPRALGGYAVVTLSKGIQG